MNQRDPAFLIIVVAVCAVHAGMWGWLAYHPSWQPPQFSKPHNRVLVKTIKLKAEKVGQVDSGEPSVAMASERTVKKVEKPKPEKALEEKVDKPKLKRPPEKKVEKAKPKKPPEKKAQPSVQAPVKKEDRAAIKEKKSGGERQKLLQKAQESIAKIEERGDKLVSSLKGERGKTLDIPGKVESLSIETVGEGLGDGESAYRDGIASNMRLFMRLPEYGSVTLTLTLNRAGKAVKVVIHGAESERNRAYAESTLPGLSFPPFGKTFAGRSEVAFNITLTNE